MVLPDSKMPSNVQDREGERSSHMPGPRLSFATQELVQSFFPKCRGLGVACAGKRDRPGGRIAFEVGFGL